ncbi:MAG: tetratricopeptide repeat protein, partial [Planctomycetota bacterium]|nr:tetratricopeptide repeat protein [Planctomycetota bacterium]
SGNKESRLIGVSHWKRVLKNHKDYKDTERLHWKLARAFRNMGRYDECEKAYRAFLSVSKDDDKKGQARFQIAESYERRGNYEQARQAFGTFLGRHPSHQLFASAQQRIATSWISEGEEWAKEKSGIEKAVTLWRQFLKRYPVHGSAPSVLYKIATVNYQNKRWDEAIKIFDEVVQKYPRQYGSASLYYTALIYEKEQDNLSEAILKYEQLVRKFPYSSQARNAGEVLRIMRQQSLRLETPRSFHSQETPYLNIVSRNAPTINFKAYRLDLKEYFEKKRSIVNIEQLAVGLVKATKEWTLKTPKYEDYRHNEHRHELPLRGEGAWVLTAETNKYVATSLILVTDIVTVIKRSPKQILVFAKNRVSGKPANGVDVMLALDGRMVEGGKTNQDGIYQKELDGYKVQVFAKQGKSVSYAQAHKQNSQSFGYSAKGYIYTDRPVYRPGHVVHYKGILREIDRGQYIRPKKAKVRVRIIDSQGLVLRELNTNTNEFGTVRGSLTLGREVSLGEYKVELTNNSKTYSGCFYVEEYKKPEVLVNVATTKSSYLSGEVVQGKIKTSYYYGGVVPNCRVTYQVTRVANPFDASVHKSNAWFYKSKNKASGGENISYKTATADKNGELKFSFKTITGSSDFRYVITAWVQGPDRRTVTGSGQVYCTHRGYYALVESNKKVVKPGEQFRVTFKTVQASHQGLATNGELRILRLSSVGNGNNGESVIQVLPVKTNKSGSAFLNLKLDRPGDYELRFVGKDRRGTEVEGAVRIVASGDAEDLAKQAKVRADKEVYRRGDKARILLNSPKADTYALLTFEGSRVLDYKVLHLKKRSTVLELPMKDLYAPNVFVKVAIPTEDGFYQDEDEILVFKYLNVEIEADKKSYSPEGKAQFKIRTLDQSGQAVAAELSLSVVDEKVYALRSETVGGMKPFFYDQRRKNIVTTAVSSTWKYNGKTREQVKELMDEISSLKRELLIAESLKKVQLENESLRKSMKKLDSMNRSLERKEKSKRRSRGLYQDSKSEAPSAGGKDMKFADRAPTGKSIGGAGGGRWGKKGMKQRQGAAGGLDGFTAAATKVRKKFADTAFWSANVVTNGDGSATVTLDLPSNLTLWRATARGVTSQTLVGEATTQISVTKDVVASVALPRFLTHKDKAILTISGHNRTDKTLKGRLSVKLTKLAANSAHVNTIRELEAGQRRYEDLKTSVLGVGEAQIEARYETGTASDAVLRKIPVKAFGEPVQKGKSGVLTDAEFWTFEVGADRIENSASVTVKLFAGRQDALLSGLRYVRDFPYGCVEQTVDRFLPLVSARRALLKAGLPENELSKRINERCTQGALRLLALQRADGGWGWWKNDQSSPFTTGYALLGLEVARLNRVYISYNRLYKGRRAAKNLLRQVRQADARALLLYALSLSNDGSDDDFNRALRARDQLSAQGLAWLYLACKQRRRSYNTAPIIEDLKSTVVSKNGATYWVGSRRRGWTHESSEASAWAAYALLIAEPNNILVEKVASTLMARQKNGYWRSTKETAAVLFFLSALIEKNGLSALNGSMAVEINGKPFAQTKLEGKLLRQRDVELTLPSKLLKTGKNTLRLVKTGPGKVNYSLSLKYVAKADSLKNKGPLLSFDRRYRRFIRGASSYDIPGWSIVRTSARPSLASRPSLLETVSGQRLWV